MDLQGVPDNSALCIIAVVTHVSKCSALLCCILCVIPFPRFFCVAPVSVVPKRTKLASISVIARAGHLSLVKP